MLRQADGKYLVAGNESLSLNEQTGLIARFNVDGSLDTTFGTNGFARLNPVAGGGVLYDFTLQPDGKILTVGPGMTIFRLNLDGSRDVSFGENGKAVVEIPSQVSGSAGDSQSDGYSVLVQPDGNIVVSGTVFRGSLPARLVVVRLLDTGLLDSTFSGDGIVVGQSGVFGDSIIDSQGRITVLGRNGGWALTRLLPNGSLDKTFGGNGEIVQSLAGGTLWEGAITQQTNGKLILVGTYINYNGVPQDPAERRAGVALTRLLSNGDFDPSFGEGGSVIEPREDLDGVPEGFGDVAVQSDGAIVAAGLFEVLRTGQDGPYEESAFGVARYIGDPISLDADGDGVPDEEDLCPNTPGVAPTGCPASSYVALGDSYSSGFGVGDYEFGTHKDGTAYPANDCQRSAGAYGPLVAHALKMPIVFRACQGAVTHDLMFPRDNPWGESAQFDYLGSNVGLVTFSIGGNDVEFAKRLEECILGFELLPFNTCSSDSKVTEPVRESLERLDGGRATPARIIPYGDLFKAARERTPFATRIAVGYPEFFTRQGGTRPLSPDRCEGIKAVDQTWATEQLRALNSIIKKNAERNGFLFVDPSPYFDGHEFCSGGDEWFFPLIGPSGLDPGRFHPTSAGHRAFMHAVLDVLDGKTGPQRSAFTINDGESVLHGLVIPSGKGRLITSTEWPGSDVLTSLTSPSGDRYTRSNPGPNAHHANGATWEQFEIADPEPGEWLVQLYGASVSQGGEPVRFVTQIDNKPNAAPVARISYSREGTRVQFDAAQSSDSDGQIRSYDWYVTSPAKEVTAGGPTLDLPADAAEGRTVTLVVTDNDGATDFADVTLQAVDTESRVLSDLAIVPNSDRVAPWLRGLRLEEWTKHKWKTSRIIRTKRVRLTMRLAEAARVGLSIHTPSGAKRSSIRARAWDVPEGKHSVAMTGLLRGAKPGRYRLSLTAVDRASNTRAYGLGFRLK